MKKIYFACSIRGGRTDQPFYEELVEHIKLHAEVLSEMFGDPNLTEQGHKNMTDQQIWTRDVAWINDADGIIAEVTNPSLGVGYEISLAENLHKPVLALYRAREGNRLSAMINGSPSTTVLNYENIQDVEDRIKSFIASLG